MRYAIEKYSLQYPNSVEAKELKELSEEIDRLYAKKREIENKKSNEYFEIKNKIKDLKNRIGKIALKIRL